MLLSKLWLVLERLDCVQTTNGPKKKEPHQEGDAVRLTFLKEIDLLRR